MSNIREALRPLTANGGMELTDDAKAAARLLEASIAGHDCVYHAVPLVPGDALGPQTAACVTCGQPPRVSDAGQPAAAEVSDGQIDRICYLATEIRFAKTDDAAQAVIDQIRAILALRPQAVPMSRKELGEATARAHIAFCLAKFDTYEEALLTEFQAHHGITAPAGGEG